MKTLLYFIILSILCSFSGNKISQKIFDVHIHGSANTTGQIQSLKTAGVYKAAISSSWELQNSYRDQTNITLLYGLMFPCPVGKVPYSQQACFTHEKDWPPVAWVEQQIREKKIDFLGEILSQYYGISSSDSLLYPYYALAQKYDLPVGIHTGGAGPDHGSPNFQPEMGSPALLQDMLKKFPGLKVWIMHSGDQFLNETISIMQLNKQVYSDISVISNPDIVNSERFTATMKTLIEAGLEDRLLFGTDNGDINKVISAVNGLKFLSKKQKAKLFYKNAERFFATK